MQNIDPKRLVELRHQKGLTRQALAARAHVSERQIARIEEKSLARVRPITLERIAKALDEEVEAITGEQPLPASNVAGPLEIDPANLKALRTAKGWSRRQLADRSKVSVRQLARLEASRNSVRMTTFKRIADALGTDDETLSGASPVALRREKPEEVGVRVRVSPQLQLAYDLVSFRYGPTRKEIVELAPLLFVLLAEGSLAWRRERAETVDELIGRLQDVSKQSAFYGASFLEYVLEGTDHERASIEKADLMGNDVRREEWGDGYGVPFCDYLCKLAEDLRIAGTVDFYPDDTDATVGFDTIWGSEPYEVCRNLLGELTGGSRLARRALLRGNVRLSEIPGDLLSPNSRAARVAWLEDKLSDQGRFEEELASSLSSVPPESQSTSSADAESAGEER